MARILVVEDNHANMKLACLLLRNAGHTALCAADAETGLTLARNDQPDLILMDIQLPGMDGLAATALLKRDPATSAIPVIALTAMAMKADQEKTRVAGCDAYIAKPLRYQELYAVIDTLLASETPQKPARAHSSQPASAQESSTGKPATPGGPSRDEERRNGRLILVAEDNETNQKIVLRQLALLGFAADVVGDGRLALQRWQCGDYAMLLSDLQMPEMDGYELIEAIRAQEQGARRIPIVTMSASSSKRDADKYQTPDMDGYLSKPLQLLELKATLEKWLPLVDRDFPAQEQASTGVDKPGPVDVRVLQGLVGNDPDVIREFLSDFQASAVQIALKLRVACAARQPMQAGEQAHKLMSSSHAVGARALGELCTRMESAGKAGSMEAVQALLPMFEQELAAVDAFLDSVQAHPADCDSDA